MDSGKLKSEYHFGKYLKDSPFYWQFEAAGV
jgi:hypothetical protein